MKIKKLSESEVFKNSETCEVREYEFGDPEINVGTAKLSGRFPNSGYLANEKVKEYAYVVSGSGSIATKKETHDFAEGDLILIPAGEQYFWNANCSLVMSCSPAWYPGQSKNVD